MQFKDVIGQLDVKKQLVNMVQQNRLSHALLFLGKEGNGALSLARAFSQYLVCEKVNGKANHFTQAISLFGDEEIKDTDQKNSEVPEDSCGKCPACVKAAGIIHPDIHFSYPVLTSKSGDKPVSTDFIAQWRLFINKNPYGNLYDWLQDIGAENKQGNINAQECLDINRKLSLKSFESEYKFLIMWMSELMGNQGNRLLKLIEEPPPNTIFIFLAENEQLILPTILSRTQLVKIPALETTDIINSLETNEGVGRQKAEQIAVSCNGNYHDALQQLQHAEDDWNAQLKEWMNSILKYGPAAQVKWIEEISKAGREKQKQLLKYFIQTIENAIRISILAHSTDSQIDEFSIKLNKICQTGQLEAITNELDKAIYHIERNANAKILFHALTIRIYHIISNKSVILVQ